FDLGFVAQVGAERDMLAAEAPGARERFRRIARDVSQRDVGAALSEGQHNGLPDSRRPSGDQDRFAFHIHCALLLDVIGHVVWNRSRTMRRDSVPRHEMNSAYTLAATIVKARD